MTAMLAFGGNSDSDGSQMSSPVMGQEKVSRNKRKFRSDPPVVDTNKTPSSSPMDRSSFEFSAEKSHNNSSHQQCDLCAFNRDHPGTVKPDFRLPSGPWPFEMGTKEEVEESQDADWSDPTESQLEDIVLKNLDSIYKGAVKKIVACGYAEDVASKAVLRSGLCYGYKDTLSNIVENALVFLRNGHVASSLIEQFDNLELLEKYVLAEMVCVLREVRPFYSIGDAMWCLLVSDMNLSQACAMEVESFSNFRNGVSSSNSTPSGFTAETKNRNMSPTNLRTPTAMGNLNSSNPKNSVVLEGADSEKVKMNSQDENVDKLSSVSMELTQTIDRSSPPEEKPGGGRKAHSIVAKREAILRQKSLHLEKYGSKGAVRQGKIRNSASLALDKKHKAVSDSPVVELNSACLNLTKTTGIDVAQTNESHIPLMGTVLATPATSKNSDDVSTQPSLSPTETELSLSQPSKTGNGSTSQSSELPAPNQNYVEIPFDKVIGQWVADDKKDEIILKLAPRVKELQDQLHGWTDWANQKVMQAARRLSKDKDELKTLRLEKEEMARLKKEKKSLEENTMKKLLEMENALRKASGQVDRANSAVQRLEMENARLRNQMEESKVRAEESAASCQEVMRREKNTMNKLHSWEKQKNCYQEELVTEKRKLAQLQQEFELEKSLQDQLEARRKQEENAKEEYIAQVKSLVKEREEMEASLKANEDMIRLKAENDLQKYKEDMRKLEADLSQLRLKTDSKKLAALRWGTDDGHAGCATGGGLDDPTIKRFDQIFNAKELQDNMGSGDLRRERECVMCLTEEMSVVFLPCAHQVVCMNCNELHEKQGMKECPSCRTPIQRRICVRYAPSS